MMLLPTGGYQPEHTGTGGVGWNPPRDGTNAIPPQECIDYRALAQELAVSLSRLHGCRERDACDDAVLAKAKQVGLEVIP